MYLAANGLADDDTAPSVGVVEHWKRAAAEARKIADEKKGQGNA